jgi:hypothetical protein
MRLALNRKGILLCAERPSMLNTLLASWKTYMLSGLAIFGVGEAVPSDFGFVMQFGALGILAVAVWKLLDELKAARTERIESEKIRHDDSEKLHETLRAMTANCAAVQAKREAE